MGWILTLYIFLILILLGFSFFLFSIFPKMQWTLFKNTDFSEEFFYESDSPVAFFERDKHSEMIAKVKKSAKNPKEAIGGGLLESFSGTGSCEIYSKTYGRGVEGGQFCLGFGDCAKVCPQRAISFSKGEIRISENCSACGKCVGACPFSLISVEKNNFSEKCEKRFKFWKICSIILERWGKFWSEAL